MKYDILRIDLKNLPIEKKEKYSLFIPPQYRTSLEGKDPYGISFTEVIAIGLEADNEPAGIVIGGFLGRMIPLAETYVIHLEEGARKEDLADRMLAKYEEDCFLAGAAIIIYNFRKTEPDCPFFEKVLKKRQWSPPKLYFIRYFFDGPTFRPPWYERPPSLPPKYEIFAWNKLKKEEREQLLREYEQGHFSERVYPFQNEDMIEYKNSLGLRCKGKVVGWSITHRVSPDTLRYTALYVKPELKYLGIPIRLLVESTKLQQENNIKWALFEINVEDVEPSWFKFVQKRLAPYAIETDTVYQTWKAAGPDVFSLKLK